jgi:hypothetical protein
MQAPIFPIAAFHISLVLGLVSLTFDDINQNRAVGIRIPRTLNDPEQWRAAHQRAWRIMPWISGICALASVSAFWIPGMRTLLAATVIVGIQMIALFVCALL